jgi:hypothetical protein
MLSIRERSSGGDWHSIYAIIRKWLAKKLGKEVGVNRLGELEWKVKSDCGLEA